MIWRRKINLPIQLLGQSGCRLECLGTVVYLDPYLSNSVQELDAPDLQRLMPVPVRPEDVMDADWVLITHDHIDHCDPHTLPKIAESSQQANFVGPAPVIEKLENWGISKTRLHLAKEAWTSITADLIIHAIPAAHPNIERDSRGNLLYIGFLLALEIKGNRLYLAGDTSVTQELIDILNALGPISTAVLPVNEKNFFRSQRGIIGNMTVREAFGLAEAIGVKSIIPVHWDMFAINSVDLSEIRAVYEQMKPSFDLQIQPNSIIL